jgi:hypothetical protein
MKMAWVETKLFLREPISAFFMLVFPLIYLFLFGAISGNTEDITYSYNSGTLQICRSINGVVLPVAENITSLAFSPDGREVLGPDAQGRIGRWALPALRPLGSIEAMGSQNYLAASCPQLGLLAASISRARAGRRARGMPIPADAHRLDDLRHRIGR